MEHYFKAKTRTPLGFLKHLGITFAISVFCSLVLASYGGDSRFEHIMSIVVGIGIFVLIFATILNAPDYVITPTELRFVKRGEVIKSFPYHKYTLKTKVEPFTFYFFTQYHLNMETVRTGEKNSSYGIQIETKEYDEFINKIRMYTEQQEHDAIY